uniref:RGS domain-containing protein n=1 Tax=Panagrellus redivivus TaxID=6233 RepID=A0A7E4WB42_PANRE
MHSCNQEAQSSKASCPVPGGSSQPRQAAKIKERSLQVCKGPLQLHKPSMIEFVTKGVLIFGNQLPSCEPTFECDVFRNIREARGCPDWCPFVQLFCDENGFYAYMDSRDEYLHFTKAVHVDLTILYGIHALKIIVAQDDVYYCSAFWVRSSQSTQRSKTVDLFYKAVKTRLLNHCSAAVSRRPATSKHQENLGFPKASGNPDIVYYPSKADQFGFGIECDRTTKRKLIVEEEHVKQRHSFQPLNKVFASVRSRRAEYSSKRRSILPKDISSLHSLDRPDDIWVGNARDCQSVQTAGFSNGQLADKVILSKGLSSTAASGSETGVVLTTLRKGDTTASHSRNVAGCSAGPSDQIIATLKDIKLDNNEDEHTGSVKGASANGAAEAVEGDAPETDIETALSNEAEAQKFLEFLNHQYCSENLYFYLSVQKYKLIDPDDLPERIRQGNQIFERHFAPNCNEPVNVEYATNKAILEAKRLNNFQPETYDHAQYQIFHLLKYDVWPRYMRAEMDKRSSRGGAENDVSSEHTETSSCDGTKSVSKMPSMRELRYCMVLSADSASSEREILGDPLISVKRWTETMAQRRGMDKNATEVVDAQTGSTIDPARQAIDALNNRHVRLMPVVRFPVDFLAPTVSSKNCSPMPAKVVMLRVRQGLTLNKALRPLLIKYNFDLNDVAVCFGGTCDQVPLLTSVGSICPRMVTVMTQQQFKDRKLLPKREYQKELIASPMLASNQELNIPFFQHGDIAFYELPTEADAKQKHSAIRSHSTNPRLPLQFQELFKFGRKASQAKSKSDNEGIIPGTEPQTSTSSKPTRDSDRRKSIGPSGRSAAPTPATVASSDIPYCGESSLQEDSPSASAAGHPSASPKVRKEIGESPLAKPRSSQPLSKESGSKPSQAPARATSSEGPCAAPKGCFEMPDFLKKGSNSKSINDVKAVPKSGLNGNAPRVPAIYASTIGSDREGTSSNIGADKISWYADYV